MHALRKRPERQPTCLRHVPVSKRATASLLAEAARGFGPGGRETGQSHRSAIVHALLADRKNHAATGNKIIVISMAGGAFMYGDRSIDSPVTGAPSSVRHHTKV